MDNCRNALKLGEWTVSLYADGVQLTTYLEKEPREVPEGLKHHAEGYVVTKAGQELTIVVDGPTKGDIEVEIFSEDQALFCIQIHSGNRKRQFEICGAVDNTGVYRAFTVQNTVIDVDADPEELFRGELLVWLNTGRFRNPVPAEEQIPDGVTPKSSMVHANIAKLWLKLSSRDLGRDEAFLAEDVFESDTDYVFCFYYNTRELHLGNSNGSVPPVIKEENATLLQQNEQLMAKNEALKKRNKKLKARTKKLQKDKEDVLSKLPNAEPDAVAYLTRSRVKEEEPEEEFW